MMKINKNSTKKIFLLFIGAILIAVAVYFLFFNKNSAPQSAQVLNSINEYPSVSNNIKNTYTLIPSQENSGNNVYTDSQYRFSFQYPKDFTVTKFSEAENTSTILIQKKGTNNGFQVFISPFDEPGPLTKQRIQKDLPDLIIENPEQRVLKNGAVALIFFSQESPTSKTREVWFIKDNHLYQISTFKELDSLVAEVLKTWNFQ